MLAGVPFTFSLDLDPGAVDKEVERPIRTPIGDVDYQGFLPTAERTEIRHQPGEACQPQGALEQVVEDYPFPFSVDEQKCRLNSTAGTAIK